MAKTTEVLQANDMIVCVLCSDHQTDTKARQPPLPRREERWPMWSYYDAAGSRLGLGLREGQTDTNLLTLLTCDRVEWPISKSERGRRVWGEIRLVSQHVALLVAPCRIAASRG